MNVEEYIRGNGSKREFVIKMAQLIYLRLFFFKLMIMHTHLPKLRRQIACLQRIRGPPYGDWRRGGITVQGQAVQRRSDAAELIAPRAKSALEGDAHGEIQNVLPGLEAEARRSRRCPPFRRFQTNFKHVRPALPLP